jgi:uncharacterized membrane protein YbhN (UPF0104 family)
VSNEHKEKRSFRPLFKRVWNTYTRLGLGLLLGATLGWLAVRGVQWDTVGHHFRQLSLSYLVLALAVFLAMRVLSAHRWQVLFVEHRQPLWRLFLVQNVGVGTNNVAPVRVLSEAIQWFLLTVRYKLRGGEALATLAMERVLDFIATVSLTLLLVLIVPIADRGDLWPYIVAGVAFLAGALFILSLMLWASVQPFLLRVPSLGSFLRAAAQLARAKARLTYSLLLSFIYWIGIGLCGWLVAYAMGLDISAAAIALGVLGTLIFVTALPGMPFALGSFEFGVVYVLRLLGVQQEQAFSFALVVHGLLFIPPTAIAVLYFVSTGISPLRLRSVERDKPSETSQTPQDRPV